MLSVDVGFVSMCIGSTLFVKMAVSGCSEGGQGVGVKKRRWEVWGTETEEEKRERRRGKIVSFVPLSL